MTSSGSPAPAVLADTPVAAVSGAGRHGESGAAPQPLKLKATRTYTGEALARRQAWGRAWGTMQAEYWRNKRKTEAQ